MQIVGLDLGRRNVKLYNGVDYISFPAIIGEWRDIKLETSYGNKGFRGNYNGDLFFAGTLAENESEFARQMLVEEKSTPDALLLALIALYQLEGVNFDVVTGLPVNIHDNDNKEKLIKLLEGSHLLELNGIKKVININRVRVAVEGGGAFWSSPKDGLVRIIDGGSKTINYITLNNRKYVDRDSGTLPFGFDTNKSEDLKQMANRIAGELGRKWGKADRIYTVGGNAKILKNFLKPYFTNIDVLRQDGINYKGEYIDLNLFANAVGYYNIGGAVGG